MKRYKITISYDGTDYQGWQYQPEVPTIAGTLIETFKSVFKLDISILGASRTDAGVHAQGQVARIQTKLDIDPEKMKSAWNNKLPSDIVIDTAEVADPTFHPLKNVKQKTYIYHFFTKRPSPFVQRFGYYYHWPLDLEKLHKCLSIFVGKHDFRSFATGHDMDTTIRIISYISVQKMHEEHSYRIVIQGPSFLRYMIRRIVGASMEVASREYLDIDYLKKIFDAKNPEHTLPTAPAKGLMLYKIEYDKDNF